jgi:ribosomal protein S18 acetylase RimI-like enzyme
MANIIYVSGNKALLNKIEPLWQQLNSHHLSRSPYFKDYYRTLTFQDRKRAILQRALGGEVRVDLALNGDTPIAYCVSSIDRAQTGEIDSIFVDTKYRGQGIGRTLMEKAIAWLSSVGAKKKIVSVGVGNEQAYGFYARFGFLPRRTMLEQKQ